MTISHISLPTGPKSFQTMKDWYAATLSPLSYTLFMEHEGVVGFRQPRSGPDLWLHSGPTDYPLFTGDLASRTGKTHLAFEATSEAQVRSWHSNALKYGATDNGAPGPRPHYVKGYYSAYVIDPLGHNIEVLYYQPLWLKAVKATPFVVTAVLGAAVAYAVTLVQTGALDGVIENVKKYAGVDK
jgi:catechol 2,3-dioxygenase-like lactoylglutathione lyase family enzyme